MLFISAPENLGNFGIFRAQIQRFLLFPVISNCKYGAWFNYACVDKSVPNWITPTSSNNYGTTPNRSIDAIMGVRVDLTSSF